MIPTAAEHGSAVAREAVRLGLAGRDPVRQAYQDWHAALARGSSRVSFAQHLLARGLIDGSAAALLDQAVPADQPLPEHLRGATGNSSLGMKIPPELLKQKASDSDRLSSDSGRHSAGSDRLTGSGRRAEQPARPTPTSPSGRNPIPSMGQGESTLEFRQVIKPADPGLVPAAAPRPPTPSSPTPRTTVEFKTVLSSELDPSLLDSKVERTMQFDGVLRPQPPLPRSITPPPQVRPAVPANDPGPPPSSDDMLGLQSEELQPSQVVELMASTADSGSSRPDGRGITSGAALVAGDARGARVFAADSGAQAEIDSEEAPPQVEPPRPGEVVGGHELVRVIGRGGMGVIYLANRQKDAKQVAFKALVGGEDPGADRRRQRFRREFEALRRLEHEHIVKVHDYGRQGPIDWYTMDFVDGTDLEALLFKGEMEANDKLDVFQQVCQAIAHAHERQVVHRDLKPQNVLVDGQGRAHVVDFGLAKILDQGIGMTRTGSALGTPFYMAPEQLKSAKDVDARADVFALGVMLYELVVGVRPFEGETAAEVGQKILNDDPARPTQVKKSLHPDLDGICLRALEKDPERRYADAQGLLDDLRRHRKGQGVAGERGVRGAGARGRRWAARNRAALFGGVVATLITGPVAAFFALRQTPPKLPPGGGAISALPTATTPTPTPPTPQPGKTTPPKLDPPKPDPLAQPPPKPVDPPPKPVDPPPPKPVDPPPKPVDPAPDEPHVARTPEELLRLGLRPPLEPGEAGAEALARVHSAPDDQLRLVLALDAHLSPALARGDLAAARAGLQLLRREGILLADPFAEELERDLKTLADLRRLLALRIAAKGAKQLKLSLHGCAALARPVDAAQLEPLPDGFFRLGASEAWLLLDPLQLDLATLRALVKAGPGERLDPAGPGWAIGLLALWRGASDAEVETDFSPCPPGPPLEHRRALMRWLPRAREAAWRALEDKVDAELRKPRGKLAGELARWKGALARSRAWQVRRAAVLSDLAGLAPLDELWATKSRGGEERLAWSQPAPLPPGFELVPARDDPKDPRPFRAEISGGALRLENGRLQADLADLLPSTALLEAGVSKGPLAVALGDLTQEIDDAAWVVRHKGTEVGRDAKKRSLTRAKKLELDRRGEGPTEERVLKLGTDDLPFSLAKLPLVAPGRTALLSVEAAAQLRLEQLELAWRPDENKTAGAALAKRLLGDALLAVEAEAARSAGERVWTLSPELPAGVELFGAWQPGSDLSGAADASCVFLTPLEAGVLRLRLAWDDGPGVRLGVRPSPTAPPAASWLLPGWLEPDLNRWREVELRFHAGGRQAQVLVDGLPLRALRERDVPAGGCFGLEGIGRTKVRVAEAELWRLGPRR